MLQDIRYPYLGALNAEALHKFSERVFDRLCKDHQARPLLSTGRQFIFTLDPLQDGSSQQDLIIRTDVFRDLLPGGTEVMLPLCGDNVLVATRISPIFKKKQRGLHRDTPILDWLNKRKLVCDSGIIVEMQHQETRQLPRYAQFNRGVIPETLVYIKIRVENPSSFYVLLRQGIGDNRAYGLGFLITL